MAADCPIFADFTILHFITGTTYLFLSMLS
nr:MAG TPA: hypothetical protein [Crassvirales sp.]